MMKKKTHILLIICSIALNSYAQKMITKQEKGYFNLTEIAVFTGNNEYEFQVNPTKFIGTTDRASALSLRNINGVFLTNKISVGLGAGLENYTRSENSHNYNNLFLLFLDSRYYFKNSANTFFAYGDVGGSLKIARNIDKGTMFNLGIGYKFKIAPKTALTTGFGYADQTIKNENENVTKDRYYGFSFKAGILF